MTTNRNTTLEKPVASTSTAPSEVAPCVANQWLLAESDVVGLSQWFDQRLEDLETQFRSFWTRDSLMSSISR